MDLDSLSILLLSESLDIDSLILKIIKNPVFEILLFIIIILILIIILIRNLNNREERMKHKKRQRISYQTRDNRTPHNKMSNRKDVENTTTRTRSYDQNDISEKNEQTNDREEANISRDVKDSEVNNASKSFREELIESSKETVDPVKISSQKNEIQNYIMLTVKNGLFVEADPCGVYYYRTWMANGKKFYEFVNNDRTKKAINNRSVLIEPFCTKIEQSISPDESDMIETIEPGILADDNSVKEKAKIVYK